MTPWRPQNLYRVGLWDFFGFATRLFFSGGFLSFFSSKYVVGGCCFLSVSSWVERSVPMMIYLMTRILLRLILLWTILENSTPCLSTKIRQFNWAWKTYPKLRIQKIRLCSPTLNFFLLCLIMPRVSSLVALACAVILASSVFCRPIDEESFLTFKNISLPEMLSVPDGPLSFEALKLSSITSFETFEEDDSTAFGKLISISTLTMPDSSTDSSSLQAAAVAFRTCSGINRFAYCCGAFEYFYQSMCDEGQVASCFTLNVTPRIDSYRHGLDADFALNWDV